MVSNPSPCGKMIASLRMPKENMGLGFGADFVSAALGNGTSAPPGGNNPGVKKVVPTLGSERSIPPVATSTIVGLKSDVPTKTGDKTQVPEV